MTPQNVMIGDWLYNRHHKKNIQITPYDFFTHGHKDGEQYLNEFSRPSLFRDKEPIPLTEEILLKNGFMKVVIDEQECFTLQKDTIFIILRLDVRDYWRNDVVRNTENRSVYQGVITYVHELQHAIRLVGDNEFNFLV